MDKLCRTLDFHESTLLHRKGATVFQSLTNGITGENIHFGNTVNMDSPLDHEKPLLLSSMPNYLGFQFARTSQLSVKSIKTFPGSLINLKAYPNYESYLGSRFNNKKRAQFRSSKALLGHCFEVVHKVHFGAIDKVEYDKLFDALIEMHLARLGQKGTADDTSGMWALYRESAYRQILDKQACISVIYHRTTPIAISLNFILGKIVHGFNRSFDMAYSKFGLGNIELLNMVQWCFEQGFEILDFMKGEYNYKNKFTDTPYWFTIQLAYWGSGGQKRKGMFLYCGLGAFYALYNFARSFNLHRAWHKIKQVRSKAMVKPPQNVIMQILSPDPLGTHEESRLDWEAIQSPALRRAICDFCHKHKTPLRRIGLYSSLELPNAIELKRGSQILLISENKGKEYRQSKL